jgi:hypothetical protein
VLCSLCGTNLPDGSRFCLSCGKRTGAADNAPIATTPSQSLCANCGKRLPPTGAFCLHCGRPVESQANRVSVAINEARTFAVRARRQRRVVILLSGLVLLGVALWVAIGRGPAAGEVQEFVRWSQAQTIVDASVPLNPRSFSSHEFTIPPGALDVIVDGEFAASPGSQRHTIGSKNEGGKDPDDRIEVYVLSNSAFAVWSSGYSTDTLYQSGSVAEAAIYAPLPAGGGVYDLVFSNRTSTHAKTVHTTILLRYKSGWPNAVLRLKERLWNWLGL